MKHEDERVRLIAAARQMNALGINQGTSGNVSVRVPDGLLVTPSGLDYDALAPDDVVGMDFEGRWESPGGRRPTSEWRIHRDVLGAHAEFGAVVHAHARFATVLACQGLAIPAFHYMVAIAGGDDVRCAPYATFGSEALSRNALEALDDRKACLLAHHGLVACGTDLSDALHLAVEVETLAAQYWHVLQLGEPRLLPPDEMARVLEKFRAGYGYASEPSEADR